MTWLFTLLAMGVIALVAGVVTGRIAGSMEPPETSLPFRGLPENEVVAADLEDLRFDAALRGYRMDEVDEVIDRLAVELQRRDDEIAALRAALGVGDVGVGDGPEPVPDHEVAGPLGGSLGGRYEGPDGGRYEGPDGESSGAAYAPPGGAFDLRGWSDPGRG